MCGIAGIVDLNGFDPARLTSMTHLVKHRGPDGFGFAFFGLDRECGGELVLNEDRLPRVERPIVGLGHRRLAILDLSPLGRTTTSSLVRVCCILASRFLVAPGNYKVEFRLLVLVPQRVVSSGFASSLLLMARFFGEQQILLPHAGSG